MNKTDFIFSLHCLRQAGVGGRALMIADDVQRIDSEMDLHVDVNETKVRSAP
jgi:hypothetical protein